MSCNPSSGFHQDDGSEVMAKPREELHSNPKSIANCKELHLGRRGITRLSHMEAFRSLEVLWLNGNSLLDITNLDSNPTIRSLYAHDNRIKTLKGSLLGFKFLHTLTLGNNRIDNLQGSLGVLMLMRHLRYLDLTGNPLADETGYRLFVIKTLPWLETLDMHEVTDEERRAARRTRFPQRSKASELGRHKDSAEVTQDLVAKETKTEKSWECRRGSISVPLPAEHRSKIRARAMLDKELSRMKNAVKNHRILLKEWFRAEDPRREGVVLEALFTRCLRQHGLWPPPQGTAVASVNRVRGALIEGTTTSAAPTTLFTEETGLLAGNLLEAFRILRPPTRARFLGRDPVYQRQIFIDYVAFCSAVEPKHGGRDLDNNQGERGERGERELDKAWKAKSAIQYSGGMSARRERGGVRAASLRRQEDFDGRDRGRDREEIEYRGAANFPKATLVSCSEYISKKKSPGAGGVGGLDDWERIELKRAFEAQGGGSGEAAPTLISRAQALSAFKTMEKRGRRPRIFGLVPLASTDDDSFNQLSGNSHGGSSETTASVGWGAQSTNFDVLFDAAVAETSKDDITEAARSTVTGMHELSNNEMADIAVLTRALEDGVSSAPTEGVVGLAPLEWVWLSRVEAEEQARELYREASLAQRRLLLLASDDEDDAVRQEAATPIRDNIAILTRNAARLENLASAASADYSSSIPLHDSPNADAAAAGRAHRIPLGDNKKRPSSNRAPAAPPSGRVDFYLVSEYHGYPFKRPGKGG